MFTYIQKSCFAFFITMLILFSWSATPTSVNADKNRLIKDEEIIKAVIDAYFTIRYEARISREPIDFSAVTASSDSMAQTWLQLERNRKEIELFSDETFQINYLGYEFSLEYQSIKISGPDAIVNLLESNKIFYTNRPSLPSQTANLEHILTLKKLDGQWKIVNDKYYDETMKALEILTTEDILKNIQEKAKPQSESSRESQTDEFNLAQSSVSRSYYNGQAAINYTANWWNRTNPTYNDEIGNDCTNFASQAIYEGTNHTMSSTHNYNTDWYYDFYTHTGSYPWVHVGGIFTFITTNNGTGPYGYNTGEYLCYLGPGDIVTMKLDGVWKHTVVVRSVTQCHDPSQIYVDAHDVDSYNRPLSDYYSYDWDAIDIEGYR